MNTSSTGSSSKSKAGSSSQPSETSFKRKRGVFQKDLQHMMYGFGDDANRGKLSVEDFLFLIRKDPPKLNRCTELLSMQEELKQARKAFEVDEEKLASTE
uniref:Transcription initiation factor TFIID subunit 13 n=1 Tax=Salix viminalis TaxID=40686 RepID=A0A6N2MZ74_SALVM